MAPRRESNRNGSNAHPSVGGNRPQKLHAGYLTSQSIAIAAIVVACLCLLGMLLVGAWSRKVKARERWAFKWFGLPVAVGSAIVYFTLVITNQLLTKFEVTVYESYILLPVFTRWFFLQTAVLVLSIIYAIIHNRFANVWHDGTSRFAAWWLIHYGFLGMLTILWMVNFVVHLMFTLKGLGSGAVDFSDATARSNAYLRVSAAFQTLYFVAALDVFVCAVVIVRETRSRKDNSRICTYLFAIITPFLLISSLVLAVYSIHFSLLRHFSSYANLFSLIFADFPNVVVFAGIVLVGMQDGWYGGQHRSAAGGSSIAEGQCGDGLAEEYSGTLSL